MEKNLRGLYIAVAIIILGGLYIAPSWSLLIAITALIVILLNMVGDSVDKRFLTTLFLAGLSARLIALAIIHYHLIERGFCPGVIESLPDAYEGSLFFDEHNFIKAAREIYFGIGNFQQYYFRNAHLALLSWLFSHFGYDPLMGKLINCLAGTLTALVVYRCGRILYPGYGAAKCAAVITMFYPSVFFWSITNLRDPIIMFLAILYFLFLIYFSKNHNLIYGLCAFAIAAVTEFFRFGYLYIFTGLLFVAGLYAFVLSKIKRIHIFLFVFVCIFLAAVPFSRPINAAYNKIVAEIVDKQFCNAVAGKSEGNYLLFTKEEIEGSSRPITLLRFTHAYLKGIFYFIFSPFLWEPNISFNLLIIFQTLLWYLLLPFIVWGIILSIRHNFLGAITFIFLMLNVSYLALLEGNVGTLFRHRDVIMPVFFIFLARGLTFKINPSK